LDSNPDAVLTKIAAGLAWRPNLFRMVKIPSTMTC